MVSPAEALRSCLSPNHFLSPIHYHLYRYLVCGRYNDRVDYVESTDGRYAVVTVKRGEKYDGLVIGVSDGGKLFVDVIEHNTFVPFLETIIVGKSRGKRRRKKPRPEDIRGILGYDVDLPNTESAEISAPGRYRLQGDLVAEIKVVEDVRREYAEALAEAVSSLLTRFHDILLASIIRAALESRGVTAEVSSVAGSMYMLRVPLDPAYVSPLRAVAAIVELLRRELRYVLGNGPEVCAVGECDIPVYPGTKSVTIYLKPSSYLIPGYEEIARRVVRRAREVAMRARPMVSVERIGRHKVRAVSLPRRAEVVVPSPRLPEIGVLLLRDTVALEGFYVKAGTVMEISHPEHGEKRVVLKEDSVVMFRARPVIGQDVIPLRNAAALAHLVEELVEKRTGAEGGGNTGGHVGLDEGGGQ